MNRLEAHKKDLYSLRYSSMCKPACEVANFTQLESHTTRARTLMLWRIAAGYLSWGPGEVEILYQSTLDSISEAFDIFHYPISRYILDARADVWDAELAPECVKRAVKVEEEEFMQMPLPLPADGALLIAGEIAQLGKSASDRFLSALHAFLKGAKLEIPIWMARTGALAYALGAREVARQHAEYIVDVIKTSQVRTIIIDGPETEWSVLKLFPELGATLPEKVQVKSLDEFLIERHPLFRQPSGTAFVHDSRPAYFLAERLPGHLAVLPNNIDDETVLGDGWIYQAPRRLLDNMSIQRVFGTWTRGLAKSCGADDGLWMTYPDLAAGLARQRLNYARSLGASFIVTSSPLCANFLGCHHTQDDPLVSWLPEFILQYEVIS
jgi:hypothetical protein